MVEYESRDLRSHRGASPRVPALWAVCGYTPPADLAWLSPSALLRWTWEMSYVSPRGISIDVHWRLTPRFYTIQIDPTILWRHRTSITLAGSELPSLTPEALLLLLAVHGAKHCWESLGWLADIAWLMRANPGLEWSAVKALAAEARCERVVTLAESLVKAVFDDALPDSDLCRRVVDRWYNHPPESPRSPDLLSFAASLAERRGDASNLSFVL